MKVLWWTFITLAAFSTIIFFYCMASIIFHGYERYLHDVATYSLLGVIVGCIFGSVFDDLPKTSEEKE